MTLVTICLTVCSLAHNPGSVEVEGLFFHRATDGRNKIRTKERIGGDKNDFAIDHLRTNRGEVG